MISKAIDKIVKEDVESLLTNRVPEGRELDYKLLLPGSKDDDKREFLADVSSFANSRGGDIIFGVNEAEGIPTEIEGLSGIDVDAETLRLEQIVREGLSPRVSGIQIYSVEGFKLGPVIILRIPQSYATPHMVTFKNLSRFFTRTSAGKSQMDVTELRTAFAVSESIGERLRGFVTERLARIAGGETPVAVSPGGKLVLHILPLSSFNLGSYINSDLQRTMQLQLRPVAGGSWNHRHNLDGFVTFSGSRKSEDVSASYCQFFRNGRIEAVWADLVRPHEGAQFIASVAYEKYVIESVTSYLKGLAAIGVPTPWLVVVSLLGVKGVRMFTSQFMFPDEQVAIDRDVLVLPEIVIDSVEADIATSLRPIFDAIWNAAGFERSFNYDKDGKWAPRS